MPRRSPRPPRRSDKQRGGYKRHDGYFHRAREEGYVARSAYKLEEIQQRHRVLSQGQRVLDLGCAPGAWLQIVAKIIGNRGRAVGVDLSPVTAALPPEVSTLEADVNTVEADALIQQAGGAYDVVLSDLAPHTTGVRHVDQARSLALTERAVEIAGDVLRDGGSLVAKVFDGADVDALVTALRDRYAKVRIVRPRATRTHSKEIYLLATDLSTAPRTR